MFMYESATSAQLFHIAGYGKVTVDGGSMINGRSVEKWYVPGSDDEKAAPDFNSIQREQSSLVLYNYVSPEAFVIEDTWYNNYCL